MTRCALSKKQTFLKYLLKNYLSIFSSKIQYAICLIPDFHKVFIVLNNLCGLNIFVFCIRFQFPY